MLGALLGACFDHFTFAAVRAVNLLDSAYLTSLSTLECHIPARDSMKNSSITASHSAMLPACSEHRQIR